MKQKCTHSNCAYPNCGYPCPNLPDCTEKQEPVAWWNGKGSVVFMHEEISTPNWTDYYNIPLYTHPPKREWVGLTDEEIRQMCGSVPSMREAVREAEAKLKEKNT